MKKMNEKILQSERKCNNHQRAEDSKRNVKRGRLENEDITLDWWSGDKPAVQNYLETTWPGNSEEASRHHEKLKRGRSRQNEKNYG